MLRALTCALSVLAPLSIGAQLPPRLALELTSEHTLPDGFTPAAVEAGAGGLLLLRGVNDARLVLLRGGDLEVVNSAELLRPIGLFGLPGDSLIEVLDGDAASLLVIRTDGTLTRRRAAPAPFQVDQGLRVSNRWLLIGRDAGGELSLAWLNPTGERAVVHHLALPDSTPPDVHASPTRTSVLVGLTAAPYSVWEVQPGSAPVDARFEQPELPRGAAAVDGEPLWVGGALVPIGDRYIRTFADVRGDRRVFVLFGSDRKVIRQTVVNSPMAFIGRLSEYPVLVAVRNITVPELLLYMWRWETDT